MHVMIGNDWPHVERLTGFTQKWLVAATSDVKLGRYEIGLHSVALYCRGGVSSRGIKRHFHKGMISLCLRIEHEEG